MTVKDFRATIQVMVREIDARPKDLVEGSAERSANVTKAPFGSWKSPIKADMLAGHTIGVERVQRISGLPVWTEARPKEGGRVVLVRQNPDGSKEDVTPSGYNVKTGANEYGGKAYVIEGDTIYFSNYTDGRIYKQVGTEATPITPEGEYRYADFLFDKDRSRLICVREDHTVDGEPENTIISVSLDSKTDPKILVHGNDFYSSPTISPDGKKIAWLSWDHPNMPWDGTLLSVSEFSNDGSIQTPIIVAGGETESIFQPTWSPTGQLYYVSDRNEGWWNLYRRNDDNSHEPIREGKVEFGLPQWEFGMTTYGFTEDNEIVAAVNTKGVWGLEQIDTDTKEVASIKTRFSKISNLTTEKGRVTFIGASPTEMPTAVSLSLRDQEIKIVQQSTELSIDPEYVSVPQAIEFHTSNRDQAYGFYYEPKNKDYTGKEGEKPPLIVISHGGPTDAASNALNLEIQFWTSRGFAVLDVNYRGSSGYGKAYREKLNGQWGIADVEDCVSGANFLVEQEKVDPKRLIVRGESAGGYTTLAALAFKDDFAAGASYYGICDLKKLAENIPKMESRYLKRLVAGDIKIDDEELVRLFKERSPINHIDSISSPLIIFQGLDDEVVSPVQGEMIHDAVKSQRLPTAILEFEDEEHGFERADTIKKALEAELFFYGAIFGFNPADNLPAIIIDNLQTI